MLLYSIQQFKKLNESVFDDMSDIVSDIDISKLRPFSKTYMDSKDPVTVVVNSNVLCFDAPLESMRRDLSEVLDLDLTKLNMAQRDKMWNRIFSINQKVRELSLEYQSVVYRTILEELIDFKEEISLTDETTES